MMVKIIVVWLFLFFSHHTNANYVCYEPDKTEVAKGNYYVKNKSRSCHQCECKESVDDSLNYCFQTNCKSVFFNYSEYALKHCCGYTVRTLYTNEDKLERTKIMAQLCYIFPILIAVVALFSLVLHICIYNIYKYCCNKKKYQQQPDTISCNMSMQPRPPDNIDWENTAIVSAGLKPRDPPDHNTVFPGDEVNGNNIDENPPTYKA